jgi:hypothetical protein
VSRLSASVAAVGNLSWTLCHGDCHGGNARIAVDGPRAGQAIFFDFDDGGPGYLAYDLAVYLWANAFFQRQGFAMWHAFIDGYRSIRTIPPPDFDAVHLFVPIRHIWLIGEYAGRIAEWGSEAVPADWVASKWTSCRPGRMKSHPLASSSMCPWRLVKFAYPVGPLWVDAVEKGVCGNLDATLIQDREPTRNLDSKTPHACIRSFQILISHFFCGDFFDSIGQMRRTQPEHFDSGSARQADLRSAR